MNYRIFKRLVIWMSVLGIFIVTPVFSQNNINLKGQNQLLPGVEKYQLLVKFSASSLIDIEKGQPHFKSSVNNQRNAANKLIAAHTFRQVISFTTAEKKMLQRGTIPPAQAGKFDHYAFRGLVYVEGAQNLDKNEVLSLAQEFEKLPHVEYAAIEPLDPVLPPATPDFTSYQHYRFNQYAGQADVYGIDAEYAWSIGVTGQGVKIADIEWGMDFLHEDLISADFIEHVATTNHDYDDHGTSVAGIMYARNNGFGMTGMVHGADKFYGISEITAGRVSGISKGLQVLGAGDVFVYEMQTGGENNEYVPADYNQAVWDITKTATDAGIIVVAAAGNGNQNLDAAFYNSYRARGDNGAIRVGAGTKVGRNKASFSTYGSIVHLQGWGDWTVASTGYSDLYNGGPHANYNKSFSGTSSATPIVASAVVAVQSYAKKNGITLTPLEMRNLLIQTGTAQGTGGHIGPLPNIRRAIEAIVIDNKLPVVSFAAPVNAQVIQMTPLAAYQLQANASDPDGTIKEVYFTINGQKITATLSGGKYVADWTPAVYGSYTITVTAVDNKLATKTASVTVAVEKVPLAYDIVLNTLVKSSATTCAATFNLQYEVENKGTNTVTAYTADVYIGGVLAKPSTRTTSLTKGQTETVTIAAIPVTASGAQSVKLVIGWTQDLDKSNNEKTISFSQTSGTALQYYISVSSENAAGTWAIRNAAGTAVASKGVSTVSEALKVQDVCLVDGCYTFASTSPFQASGCTTPAWVAGREYCKDAQVSYQGKIYIAGWCTTNNPASGDFNGWTVQGNCAQNIPADLQGLKKSDNTKTYFEVTVAAYTEPFSKAFCIGNNAPVVSITSPANNSAYTAPATIGITAAASDADGTVSKVEFYNGADKLGEATSTPYAFEWTAVTNGTYNITAKAIDNTNAVTTSAVVKVIVSPTTSFENLNKDIETSVHPNPTTGILHLGGFVDAVTITDLSGNALEQILLDNTKKINLTAYPAGVYLLQLHTGTQMQFVKVVKE